MDDASAATNNSGENLLSLQDSSTDLEAVDSQLRALSTRVKDLKSKMVRFDEHYGDHLKKGEDFQEAVERLLAKFGTKKDELMKKEVDERDVEEVNHKIAELEVRNPREFILFILLLSYALGKIIYN